MQQQHFNRLSREKSPYLRQHQANPVDWYPWGQEAFEEARRRKCPIFLSIGYSTCHWCHVMEKESFEDHSIAKILNEAYLSIKVDREERPDVDRQYMTFVQATTGSGGWPLSVFLTPNSLKPFLGGTYFPPNDHYGKPGFKSILTAIASKWKEDPQAIERISQGVVDELKLQLGKIAMKREAKDLSQAVEQAINHLQGLADPVNGGFGGAPKFPTVTNLYFLLTMAKLDDDFANLKGLAFKQLDGMARGGIRDHVAGGFHRYSVDEKWRVPHFEKMLYDQAQLLSIYAQAAVISDGNQKLRFEKIANEVYQYVKTNLQDPGTGGFMCGEDADSFRDGPSDSTKESKSEGAFAVWTAAEIDDILRYMRADTFKKHYGVVETGNANSSSDPHGELIGQNVLYEAQSINETSREFGIDEEELESLLSSQLAMLAQHRKLKRPPPDRDNKMLAAWNGLLISGLVQAAKYCKLDIDNEYVKTAVECANFIKTCLIDEKTSLLYRSYLKDDPKDRNGGRSDVLAFADDYAFVIQGFLDLHQLFLLIDTQAGKEYLNIATILQSQMDSQFWDEKEAGYFVTRKDDPHAVINFLKEDYDGAEPSPNSVAFGNLCRLAGILPERFSEYEGKADALLKHFQGRLSNQPASLTTMLTNWVVYKFYKPILISISPGFPLSSIRDKLSTFSNPLLILVNAAEYSTETADNAHICHDSRCLKPTENPSILLEQIDQILNGLKKNITYF